MNKAVMKNFLLLFLGTFIIQHALIGMEEEKSTKLVCIKEDMPFVLTNKYLVAGKSGIGHTKIVSIYDFSGRKRINYINKIPDTDCDIDSIIPISDHEFVFLSKHRTCAKGMLYDAESATYREIAYPKNALKKALYQDPYLIVMTYASRYQIFAQSIEKQKQDTVSFDLKDYHKKCPYQDSFGATMRLHGNEHIITLSEGCLMGLWHTATGKCLYTVTLHDQPNTIHRYPRLSFCKEHDLFVLSSDNRSGCSRFEDQDKNQLAIINAKDGKVIQATPYKISNLFVDKNRIGWGICQGSLVSYDIDTNALEEKKIELLCSPLPLEQKLWAIVDKKGNIILCNSNSQKSELLVYPNKYEKHRVYNIASLSRHFFLAFSGEESGNKKYAHIWDLRNKRIVYTKKISNYALGKNKSFVTNSVGDIVLISGSKKLTLVPAKAYQQTDHIT